MWQGAGPFLKNDMRQDDINYTTSLLFYIIYNQTGVIFWKIGAIVFFVLGVICAVAYAIGKGRDDR